MSACVAGRLLLLNGFAVALAAGVPGVRQGQSLSTLQVGLLLLVLGVTDAGAWNTETQEDTLGWLSVYLGNAQAASLPDSGWTANEHSELTHVILKELGVDGDFGLEPVASGGMTVVDLNSALYQPLVRAAQREGDDADTLIEERRVPPPAHFAGLPDYSWAVHNWINKNVFCPLTDAAGHIGQCHLFAGWLGALNANHFGTQAQNMYARYHRIALSLAKRARTLREALASGRFAADANAYRDFVEEGEIEALIYESVGQHFLQDRWATGHMWERWNGADEATAAPFELSFVVAAAAGLMHGSEGITKLPDPMGSPQVVTDDLGRHAVPVPWRLPGEDPKPGVGDYRLEDMHDGLFGGNFGLGDLPISVSEQRERLFSCAKAGWSEVIRAFGEVSPGHFGQHDVTLMGGPFPSVLTDERCWNAWATNTAIAVGWLEHPATANISKAGRTVGQVGQTQVIGALRANLVGFMGISWRAQSMARLQPNSTFLARGGIGPFASVPVGRGFPVPAYTEPQNLDTLPDSDPRARGQDKHALYGFFNRAHTDWVCQNLDGFLLDLRGSGAPLAEEACAYIANRAYKATDPQYNGKRREQRRFLGDEIDPICRYYGVATAGVDDDIPYFLHPGYVASPQREGTYAYDSVRNWCRKLPVVDRAPCPGAPTPPRDDDEWDVVGRVPMSGGLVALQGRHFGPTKGTVHAGSAPGLGLPVGSWSDTTILLKIPAGLLAEGDWLLKVCPDGAPDRCSVGRFILRVAGTGGAVIESTFDADLEDWTAVGQAPGGFRFQAAGGNPGGFLYLDNSETVEAGIGAPTQFHGDWSRFIGGTLTFDGNMLGIGGLQWGPFPTDYGNLTIGGPGGNMRADLAPGTHSSAGAGYPPINTWTTFSVAMDATSWGVSEATFNSILSNVSQITLSVEALFGNEVQGIDNVRVVGKAGVCSGP